MVPDWNIIFSACGLALVMVGGYVKLRVDLAKSLPPDLIAALRDISDRLLKIETRLEMDDKSAKERRDARRREMMEIAKAVVEIEIGKTRGGTNPGIQLPTDGL
jgi:hypothetical protein